MKLKIKVELKGTQEEINKCLKDATEKDFSWISFSLLAGNERKLKLENLKCNASVEDATDVVELVKKL